MTTATNIQAVSNRTNRNNHSVANDLGRFLTSCLIAVAAVFSGKSSVEARVRRPFGINDYPL